MCGETAAVRETSQLVRIEKHRVSGGIAALTFAAEEEEVGRGSRPLVFVVHGLLSRKERHIELCLALAEAGYLACTLDARHHGERATPEATTFLGGGLGTEFLMTFAEVVLGTVADLGTLADYFGRDRYGLVGHSMGGYIALKTAVTDPRAAVIVSISGNPDWAAVPDGVTLPPVALEMARAESPLSYPDRFWPRPLLLLHGDADLMVPIHGHRALFSALQPRYTKDLTRLSLVEYPGGGHEFIPDMAERAVAWMRRFLLP